jgi:hypothetical protein
MISRVTSIARNKHPLNKRRRGPPARIRAANAPKRQIWDIWPGLSRAVEIEPRPDKLIRGQSGLLHDVLQIGVDEKNRRLLVVAAEPSPRTAALMQVDIQATMPDTKVLVARPISVDLGFIARRLVSLIGRSTLRLSEIGRFLDRIQAMDQHERNQYLDRWLNEIAGPMKGQIANFSLPGLNQLISVIQQGAVFDWQGTFRRATQGSGGNTVVSLGSIAAIDNMGADLAAGVCPIPLYELTVDDLELFQSGADN